MTDKMQHRDEQLFGISPTLSVSLWNHDSCCIRNASGQTLCACPDGKYMINTEGINYPSYLYGKTTMDCLSYYIRYQHSSL